MRRYYQRVAPRLALEFVNEIERQAPGALDMVGVEPYPPIMSGISFVVDERGRKKAVMIDLEQHGSVWEDIHDLMVVRSRRREPRETLAEVEKRLAKRRRG